MGLNDISLPECAALAEQVYDDTRPIASRSVAGWEALNPMCWGQGFSATLYRKGAKTILAYRGTDDLQDALADFEMAPTSTSPEAVEQAMRAILDGYGLDGQVDWIPGVLRTVWRSAAWQRLLTQQAGRLPRVQSPQALAYFDSAVRVSGTPDCVVGHSLGGGLAQIVGLERQVPTIAFNSPYIGGLRGGVPMTSLHVLHVNAHLDPVSQATARTGALAHGREVVVTVPKPSVAPPSPPRRRALRLASRLVTGFGASGMAVGMLLETADYGRYLTLTGSYLKAVALHYHTMVTLRTTIESTAAYQRSIAEMMALP